MLGRLPKPDLTFGLRNLLPEWKACFKTQYLYSDLMAGITVACVAIPLSLAIALAAGVTPATGLVTAIVAGIVCAIFGGTTLSVSGPAAAMTVLIAYNIERFGLEALIVMGLLAGLFQVISGMVGLGKWAKVIPIPVIAGFTAGIGAIIFISQLPRAFGLLPPPETHVVSVFIHLKDYLHQTNTDCLLLVLITMAIIRFLPKLFPKAPAILLAVITSTFIAYYFNFSDIALIGSIPSNLPLPKMPAHVNMGASELLISAFTIYLLASLETLLSCSAIDKIVSGKKHNPDQELIGQGLANIAVSFFGGIPVTSVIARSSINVRSGGKTRRASIFHAIGILIIVFFLAPMISMIPIAALAGVLLSIAISMINYKEFYELWITSRAEASVYAITFFTIIFTDLIAGVEAGIVAALLILLIKAVEAHIHYSVVESEGIIRLSLTGPLTFLNTSKIAKFESNIKELKTSKIILVDLSNITNMDTSGVSALVSLHEQCQTLKHKFYLIGLPRRFENMFKLCNGEDILTYCSLVSEHEIRKVDKSLPAISSRGRLIHGVEQYHSTRQKNDRRLFEYIAQSQDPHTLFITCADSRIIPSLITSTSPGELFIIRNVGNTIPVYHTESSNSESAAIEFALSSFEINDIVICGHANCGAMAACKQADDSTMPSKVKAWIDIIRASLPNISSMSADDLAKIHVLKQIENLKTHPIVAQKIEKNALRIHAWYFDVTKNDMMEWNTASQNYETVSSTVSSASLEHVDVEGHA